MKQMNSRTKIALLVALVMAIAVAACGGQPNAAAPVAGGVQAGTGVAADQAAALDLPLTVDAQTVDDIRERDDVVIIDVREDWEYTGGHVPGATLIPLGQLASRLNEIPQDKTVVAVCRSGNRSGQATDFLRQQGFNAHNMAGGMIAWEQAGLDVER